MPGMYAVNTAPAAGVQVDLSNEFAQSLRALWLFNEDAGKVQSALYNKSFGLSTTGSVADKVWAPAKTKRTGYSPRSVMRHIATTAVETLVPNASDLFPTNTVTIALGYRKTDTTNRVSSAFGVNVASGASTCQAHLPYSDGTVYFDFGGSSNGSTRVQVGGLTFGNDFWVFTTGPRGMEIWQNGILRASNSANPTRTATTNSVVLGTISPASTGADLAEYDYFGVWHRQLTSDQIRRLSYAPYQMLQASVSARLGPSHRRHSDVTTDADVLAATVASIVSTAAVSQTGTESVTADAAVETTNFEDVSTDAAVLHAPRDIPTDASVSTTIPDDTEAPIYNLPNTYSQPPSIVTGNIIAVDQANKRFTVAGDIRQAFPVGATFTVTGSTGNDGTYTVVSVASGSTIITVFESIPSGVANGMVSVVYTHNYSLFGLRCDTRVILGLDPPKFVQEQQDTMGGTELSPYAWAMQWARAGGPIQTGGVTKLRSFGVPLFEWFETRESYGWMPHSKNHPFVIEFDIKFNQTDPVYSVPIIIPGLLNSLGDLNDPLLIYQQGSASSLSAPATVPSANNGNIRIFCNGTDVANIVNDQALHTVRVEWDPGLTTNAYKYLVKWDGVTLTESQTNLGVPPNTKVRFGWVWHYLTEWVDGVTQGDIILAIGSSGSPETVLEVSNFKTTQLGTQGYESYDDPPWVVANHGGTTHEDSDVGEIHTQDNMRWAIMPNYLLGNLSGDIGRNIQANMAQIDVLGRHGDPDEIFSFTWVNRPVLIDVRQSNGLEYTSWRRKMAGYIKATSPNFSATNIKQSLSVISMPEAKLHTYVTHTFTGQELDVPGISAGFTGFKAMWETMIEIAERIHGPIPTISDQLIRELDVVVYNIGTGGQAMMSALRDTVEKGAYEFFVDYTPTGDSRHGRIRIHAGTLGRGTPDYIIPASRVLNFSISENADEGPSQVIYRQNNPEAIKEADQVNTWGMPFVGLHPTVPVPSTSVPLSDSLAFAYTLQATALQHLKDAGNVNITGGIAQHRFRLAVAKRRQANFEVRSLDFVNPSQELEITGAVGTLDDETWVVDGEHWQVSEGVYNARLELTSVLWEEAIKRTL